MKNYRAVLEANIDAGPIRLMTIELRAENEADVRRTVESTVPGPGGFNSWRWRTIEEIHGTSRKWHSMTIEEIEQEMGISVCPHGENGYCSPCILGAMRKAVAEDRKRIGKAVKARIEKIAAGLETNTPGFDSPALVDQVLEEIHRT